jgi:hypothetical protein
MKKIKFLAVLTIVVAMFSFVSCSNDESSLAANDQSSSGDIAQDSTAAALKASISISSFNFWTTCGTYPYISGSNIIVPLTSSCSTEYDAAQQNYGQSAYAMSFDGNFYGGSGANSSTSEMAVFVCDDVTNWTGNEMGFVKTLNDNVLKAYIQGGGAYIYTTISSGNTGSHNYKCIAKSGNTHQVDFYVDNVYKFTLTNNSGYYYNRYYYFVGTNHWTGGSGQGSYKITMSSICVW